MQRLRQGALCHQPHVPVSGALPLERHPHSDGGLIPGTGIVPIKKKKEKRNYQDIWLPWAPVSHIFLIDLSATQQNTRFNLFFQIPL